MPTLGSGNFSTTLPALTASTEWGSTDAASTLPLLTQSAFGRQDWAVSTALPILASAGLGQLEWVASTPFYKLVSLTADQGGYSVVSTLPLLTSTGTIIEGAIGVGNSILPRLRGSASSERGGFASNTLPILTSSAIGYAGIVFSPSTTLPLLQMSAAAVQVLTETFNVWVMDAVSKGVSQYSAFNYNSFGKRDGVHFGANENGIYRLDSDKDDGADIDAELLFAPTGFYYDGADFGLNREEATKQKRSASIYLVCRNDGDLQLLVKVDEDKYRVYDIDSSGDPQGMHNRRVIPGRGLKGVVWQVGIANQNGADFELAAIKAYPIVLSRRV